MLTWTCLRDFFVAGNCTKGTHRHLAGKGFMWHCILKQGKRSSNTAFLGRERVNVTLAFFSRESVHWTLHSLAGKGLMWHLRSLAGKRLMGQHCKHCRNRDCTNQNLAFCFVFCLFVTCEVSLQTERKIITQYQYQSCVTWLNVDACELIKPKCWWIYCFWLKQNFTRMAAEWYRV